MKKLLLVVLAAVGLASCVQNEELSVANNNEAIAFDTFVENATKAMHTTESLQSFNVYGTISKDGAVVTNSIVPAFLQCTIICLFNHFKIGGMDLGGVLLVCII